MNRLYSFIFTLAVATITVVSCVNKSDTPDGQTTSFVGVTEDGESTKTMLTDEGARVLWEPDDAIRIFSGEKDGLFTALTESPASTTCFTGSTDFDSDGTSSYFAIYPYSTSDSFDGTNAIVTVPANQTAVKKSFDRKAFIMLAQSKTPNLSFKNLCGGVKLSVSQENVFRIVLRGNNNETLAGIVQVQFLDGRPIVSKVLEAQNSIELCCDNDSFFETGAWYFISCIPTSLPNGLTIEMYQKNGELSFSGKYVLERDTNILRSTWGRLASADDTLEYTLSPQENCYLYKTSNNQKAALVSSNSNKVAKHFLDNATGYYILELKSGIETTAFSGLFTDASKELFTDVVLPSTRDIILSGEFLDCTNLTSVLFPDNITQIGGRAFRNCTALTRINIPEGVTSIGKNAFENCSSLEDIFIPNSVTWIGSEAFKKSGLKIIPDAKGITKIEDYTFYGCSNLDSFSLPENVTEIGYEAFGCCKGLKDVTIPGTVTSIGEYAFVACSGITTLLIRDGVEKIEDRAFENCSGIKNLSIPKSVIDVGSLPFSGCDNIETITIGSSKAFAKLPKNDSIKNSLKKLIITDGDITSIPASRFGGYLSLTDVVLDNKVKTIERDAFSFCSQLKNITLSEELLSIEVGAFSGCSSLSEILLPNGIMSIGPYAFRGCGLKSIIIPDSVTSIGFDAFQTEEGIPSIYISDLAKWCSIDFSDSDPRSTSGSNHISRNGFYLFLDNQELLELMIPDGIPSIGKCQFNNCLSITHVFVPECVTQIESGAFARCPNLMTVSIPNSVTQIGDYTFYRCNSLANIILPNRLTSIGGFAFGECSSLANITIPDSITSIGRYAFNKCSALANIILSNRLTSISEYAFSECSSLADITIPNSVTSIEQFAFYKCEQLINATLPENNLSIGQDAFCSSGLTSITIPKSASIGVGAFANCDNLSRVTIPYGATGISNNSYNIFSGCSNITQVFYGLDVDKKFSRLFKASKNSIKEVVLLDGVTTINGSSDYDPESIGFDGYDALERVSLPNTIVKIGYRAFYLCRHLDSINIPDNVTSIGGKAFYGCSSLTSITIPQSITSIGSSAFYGCNLLDTIIILSSTPPSGGSKMFDNNASSRMIYVPLNSVSDYQTAEYWKDYSSSITYIQ